ncbi:AAA family ATPase [Candidatus Liberibacter africanus]|uniref:AAA family ATPase n=1 Tax=Liberibacter africanus TaxID=34020 RepID=UPI00069BCEC6|nr:AAA family ATPase [Candidatus Liberibacter africanus]
MNKLDFSDVIIGENPVFTREDAEILLFYHLYPVVQYLLPNGTRENGKYKTSDLQGGKGNSLNVELDGDNRGLWHDFATGDKGDIFDLWAISKGLDVKTDFPKVLQSIAQWFGKDFKVNHNNVIHRKEWIYTDAQGNPIVRISRRDIDGKKTYLPFDFTTQNTGMPSTNRPLYNQVELLKSKKIFVVEGEKCAEALIKSGFMATTAMQGANTDPAKTDWTPLRDKQICIWPDNDEVGFKYAEKLNNFLIDSQIPKSVALLNIPKDKPPKWDAYDAIVEGVDILEFLRTCPKEKKDCKSVILGLPFEDIKNDKTPKPLDIISSGFLVQGGLAVLAGAPKVGKSHFLFSLLSHFAAGIPFLGLKPAHPLKVCYIQAENDFFNIRDRSQQIANNLTREQLALVDKNLVVTPHRMEKRFNEQVVNEFAHNANKFQKGQTDLIAVDPLYFVFDAGDKKGGENDNDAMYFFLTERIKVLLNKINPKAGLILVHHTKKMRKKNVEENPFDALAGASGLRRYYSSAMVLFRPDENVNDIEIFLSLEMVKEYRRKMLI